MMEIIANGINDAWLQVVKALHDDGGESAPRGQRIKEIKNMSVEIKDPRKRILSLPIRNISLPFAFGELIWYLTGRNDVAMMTYYSGMMKNFSDDGETLNSAYGYRIFGKHPMLPFNQWQFIVDKLREDPDSRQAVIHIKTPSDKPTKDEVCTKDLQFLIRDGKLDMITDMRSNDIVWGFTYDVFSFTTFQELIANELGVEVGTYYHNAVSMHIYEKDFKYFDHLEMYESLIHMTQYDEQFSYDGITIHSDVWKDLYNNEAFYRLPENEITTCFEVKNKALSVMDDTLYLYSLYKLKGKDAALKRLQYDDLFHCMMRNYFMRKEIMDSTLTIYDGCDGAGKTTLIERFFDNDTMKVAFAKPKEDFNKAIYFHTALSAGDIVLDRFYLSEWVYAKHFNRKPKLNWEDIHALEKMLNHRHSNFIFVNTKPETCLNRLDENDRITFSLDDLKGICEGYEMMYRVSNIRNKSRFIEK